MHCLRAGSGKGCSSTLFVTACTRKPRLRVVFPPFFLWSCFSEMGFPHAAHASVKLLGTRDPGPSAPSFLPLKTSSAITKQQKKATLSSKAFLESSLHQASRRCLLPLLPQLTEKTEERLGQRDRGRGFLMARCALWLLNSSRKDPTSLRGTSPRCTPLQHLPLK